jgi:hypothetical protein
LLLIAAASFTSPLMAGTTNIDDLAAQSGLSKQELRMLVGARTPYPAYRTSYERMRKQLIAAIGQTRYQELVQNSRTQNPGQI